MIIHVTQEDIDNGVRKSHCRCPIALAMARAYPNTAVSVGIWEYLISKDGDALAQGPLPSSARQFIQAFDNSSLVQPFNFLVQNVNFTASV